MRAKRFNGLVVGAVGRLEIFMGTSIFDPNLTRVELPCTISEIKLGPEDVFYLTLIAGGTSHTWDDLLTRIPEIRYCTQFCRVQFQSLLPLSKAQAVTELRYDAVADIVAAQCSVANNMWDGFMDALDLSLGKPFSGV